MPQAIDYSDLDAAQTQRLYTQCIISSSTMLLLPPAAPLAPGPTRTWQKDIPRMQQQIDTSLARYTPAQNQLPAKMMCPMQM
jgi:hypothetical protein